MPRIRVRKQSAAQNPDFPTPEWSQFKVGERNEGVSLPKDYVVEGELLSPIRVGQSVRVLRDDRNGVKEAGAFVTSPVVSLTDKGFSTKNSVYLYEYLTEEKKHDPYTCFSCCLEH